MLIFDELKKNDPQLRWLAVAVAAGLGILLAGLWWVQVVSAHDYQSHLETQAYRTVRLPAVRGKILDREAVSYTHLAMTLPFFAARFPATRPVASLFWVVNNS